MNISIIPADAPLTVQAGQCIQCGSRSVSRLLMIVGRRQTWVLADQIPEGYRVHDCRPVVPKAA